MAVLPRPFDGDAKSVGVTATEHRRAPRRWLRLVFARFAGCAAATAVIGLSLHFGSRTASDPFVPPATSASDVRLRVSTALSSMRTLRGEISIECAAGTVSCPTSAGERTTRRWSFVTDAAGDERVTGIDHPVDFAFSAAQHEQRSVLDGPTPSARVLFNLAPGPPYVLNGTVSVLHNDVAPLLRAFLATAEEVPVGDVMEGDRPAWRLAIAIVPTKGNGPGTGADQLEVVVDKQSGFPLRIAETFAGQFRRDIRLSSLVVDGPVDPASFTFELPAGVKNYPSDAGFTALTIGGVEAVVGYRPLLPAPASLPAGYTRAEVSVALDLGVPVGQGVGPPSQHVVAVAYRRGFDRIVVTTRSTGTATVCPSTDMRCWTDMVPRGEGIYDPYERFNVGGGALVGAQAALAMSPRGVPHVWTIDDRLVVTVAGDASARELRLMAESFTEAS